MINMIKLLLSIALYSFSVSPQYCFSQCQSTVNISATGCKAVADPLATPYDCNAYAAPFSTFSTLISSVTNTIVESLISTQITTVNGFKMSQTFTSFTCTKQYNNSGLTYNFNYNLIGKFVSTDYIYKRYTITKPHYQLILKFSIAFVGVWAGSDYLNLYLFDGTKQTNIPLRYNCTDAGVNYTQNFCTTGRNGNHVDCIMAFTYSIDHNSTYLLINFSSLTNEKDSNVQFWSLFDLNIVTVNCNPACAACYLTNGANTCTACILPNYLTANTCAACATGTYSLLPPNPVPTIGGYCVTACPPGYYISSTSCLACSSGCLSCTSASSCLLTADSVEKYSLWKDKLALWIIIILIGIFLMGAIIWKVFCEKGKTVHEEQERIISQLNDTKNDHADEKVTMQQRETPPRGRNENNNNIHIEEIDFNDHVMMDNPRKRKRQERDINRSSSHFHF